jgi:hypothetical protein
MRFTSLSFTALSVSVALGLCVAGCKENRADSAYHPSPGSWYGHNPSTVDGTHAAQSPGLAPKVLNEGTSAESAAGTTRATASLGGTGGGPTDGAATKPEHKGHFGMTTGTIDDGAKAVSRTGKK